MAKKQSLKLAKLAKKLEAESMILVEDKPAIEEAGQFNHSQKMQQKKVHKESACVFVTGLPFGMTERNLRCYMQQFGEVLNCRVHACPKSGRTRGYGYVHFRVAEVARIAAQTMNNHLITGSVMKCRLIPGQFIKEKFFSLGDRGYHGRIKRSIDKINLTKRSDKKEKKLLRKRQKSAQEHLSKLQDSEITGAELGLPANYAPPKKTSVKKEAKPVKKVFRTKLQQPVRSAKSLVLTQKGRAALAKTGKKHAKKN